MHSPGQPVYSLAIAAQLVGLSQRTLRTYEENGLIAPARIGAREQRMYSEQDIQWLRCIRDMIHDEGLTVIAIRRLLDLVPCWEIHHCAPEIALKCAPFQKIPNMARGGVTPAMPDSTPLTKIPMSADDADVTITLIYGVEELGSVLACMRCISAERTIRRVALQYPGKVKVMKYDLLAPEVANYGVLMVPTIIVNAEIVSSGKGMSEAALTQIVRRSISSE